MSRLRKLCLVGVVLVPGLWCGIGAASAIASPTPAGLRAASTHNLNRTGRAMPTRWTVIASKSGTEVSFWVDLGKTGPVRYSSPILAHGYGLKDLKLAYRLGGKIDHSDIEVGCNGAKLYSDPAYSYSNGPDRAGFYSVDLPSGFPNSSWGPYVQCGIEMIVYGVFSPPPSGNGSTSVVSAQVLVRY